MPRVVAGLRGWGHETIDIKVPTVGKMMKYYLLKPISYAGKSL